MRTWAVLSTALTASVAAFAPLRGLVPPVGSGCTSSNQYDYFMLVTQWAITECMDVFSCQNDNQYFTLHGLWPTDNNGNYPCTCTNEQFDPTQVADLLPQMNQYWPSLNGPNNDFWSHEWSKHGTCAEDVLTSQHAFFAAALQARAKYDIVAALAKAGINPSNSQSFTLTQYRRATENAFGQAALLTCDDNGNIEETTVCLNKTLNAIPCPGSATDDCSSSSIYLPSSIHA